MSVSWSSIADDFAQLARDLGLPSTELPKVLMKNRKPQSRGHYADAYDDNTRRIVTEYYQDDLDAFGYSFE